MVCLSARRAQTPLQGHFFGSVCLLCEKSNNENGPEKRLEVGAQSLYSAHVCECVGAAMCPLWFTRAFVSFELNGGWNWKIAHTMHYACIHHTNTRSTPTPATAYDRIIRAIDFEIHVNFVFRPKKGVKRRCQSHACPANYGRYSSAIPNKNKLN